MFDVKASTRESARETRKQVNGDDTEVQKGLAERRTKKQPASIAKLPSIVFLRLKIINLNFKFQNPFNDDIKTFEIQQFL